MPRYDYRCRTCDSRFEVQRGLTAPAVPVACPAGHADTSRVFTPVAVGRGASGPAASPVPAAGGCCGGGCCG